MIDEKKVDQIATLANLSVYNKDATRNYIDGAPHIKHLSLRTLYAKLVIQVYNFAKEHTKIPRVLDLGAGEGSTTLLFLELGAKVIAVDNSASQLEALQDKCKHYGNRLEIRCEDFNETLEREDELYDIIVCNSTLHHVPDYIGLINNAKLLLTTFGQFFSFQDPLWYDSINKLAKLFSNLAYFSWRIFKGDVYNGIRRRIRRSQGIYIENSVHDNAEYHALRNGVDQDAIFRCFVDDGFSCDIIRYFSTQSRFFQFLGTRLNIKNTFAIIARK